MLGVIGGLTVVVSLCFAAWGLASAVPRVNVDEVHARRTFLMWWVVVALAVGNELAPWVLEVAL